MPYIGLPSIKDMLFVQLYTQCHNSWTLGELGDHGLIKDSASTICWTGGSCTLAKIRHYVEYALVVRASTFKCSIIYVLLHSRFVSTSTLAYCITWFHNLYLFLSLIPLGTQIPCPLYIIYMHECLLSSVLKCNPSERMLFCVDFPLWSPQHRSMIH